MLVFASLTKALALGLLLLRDSASTLDLLFVRAVGAFDGVNNIAAVAEGSRVLPGQPSAVSALLMGMPWCVAARGPVVAGVLADPARGGGGGEDAVPGALRAADVPTSSTADSDVSRASARTRSTSFIVSPRGRVVGRHCAGTAEWGDDSRDQAPDREDGAPGRGGQFPFSRRSSSVRSARALSR